MAIVKVGLVQMSCTANVQENKQKAIEKGILRPDQNISDEDARNVYEFMRKNDAKK